MVLISEELQLTGMRPCNVSEATSIFMLYHRAVVLDALVKHVDPNTVHFNKRAMSVSVSPNGRPIVHFQDGTSVETDVLIGADGIRSKVRPYVTGTEESPVKFSNTTTYRGLVASETLKTAGVTLDFDRPQILLGRGTVRAHSCVQSSRIFLKACIAFHTYPLQSRQDGEYLF